MADLAMIQLVPSKGHDAIGDCGICCLATLSGCSYEDVVAIAVQHVGEAWKHGLYLTQIIAIGRDLGLNLKRRRKYDLDHDTGILNVTVTERPSNKKISRNEHLVVLMEGRIYDSDLRVWAVDAFKQQYAADFGILLEIE